MLATVIAAAALTAMVSANPAFASVATDPPTVPPKSNVVGVGSDTTQDVMGLDSGTLATSGFAANYNATNPNQELWSWDATGSATIVPSETCAEITRPNGSSAGITALLSDEATGAECIDYARSSRVKNTATDGDLVFVPFARDGVTWATFPRAEGGTTFNAPVTLTTAQLNDIYECTVTNWNQVGGKNATIKPFLPQSGSGTRSFWLTAIGVTTPGTCVDQSVQENSGEAIPAVDRPNSIAPYSIAKHLAQTNGIGDDLRDGIVLKQIDGIKPVVNNKLNTSFPANYLRDVFNVLKPADLTKKSISKIFSTTGYICKHPEITKTFGFAALKGTACGY